MKGMRGIAQSILDHPELWGDLSLTHEDLELLRDYVKPEKFHIGPEKYERAAQMLQGIQDGARIGVELATWTDAEIAELVRDYVWAELDVFTPQATILQIALDRLSGEEEQAL